MLEPKDSLRNWLQKSIAAQGRVGKALFFDKVVATGRSG
jgi:hypothetical protein